MTTKQLVLTIVLVVAASLAVSHLGAQPNSVAPANGRFIVSSGSYSVLTNQSTITLQTVFKTDTQTGKVWMYSDSQDGQGKFHNGWNPINDTVQ